MSVLSALPCLKRDCRGALSVETAIVAPVLALLSLAGFQASALVARQTELDSAAAEAAAIVRAKPPEDAAERETIRSIVATSIDPDNKHAHEAVAIAEIYRCGTGNYVTAKPTCGTGLALSTYIRLTITDKYVPTWTEFGFGEPINYNVVRTVQIS